MVGALWNEEFRGRCAMANESESFDDPGMGDINKMRNDIVHHGAVATSRNTGRCEVFRWFRVGETIPPDGGARRRVHEALATGAWHGRDRRRRAMADPGFVLNCAYAYDLPVRARREQRQGKRVARQRQSFTGSTTAGAFALSPSGGQRRASPGQNRVKVAARRGPSRWRTFCTTRPSQTSRPRTNSI